VPSWLTEPVSVSGTWQCFRQVSSRFPPLYHAAGEPTPSQESGRWHVVGEGYAQYLALSPLGAWAELVRYYSIRSEDLAREQQRNLWLIYVVEEGIADLSTFEKWDACGLDPRHAVADHHHCQKIGQALRDAGFRGVLSPSAALPEVTNLSLFGERYERVLPGAIDIWPNPDPTIFLPCERVAQDAGPPLELITQTCFRRGPHLGYRQFLASRGKPLPPDFP
jgi:RES domain-containing protein